ncbi:cardiolipin synthetase [Agrilactobacillus composti DSM 18527 = JCM 14202]|uniref:Cardiolipin synthase n=1 Tax=Agrilactobacillus composti DSM 18527 = JCM 14202 TaxID=1423734 RepID=A0A0R1XTJ0_9LACO|nr:cardiolipin synthase [Agrilactobacillus composti]KRM33249.1 cardiolipin synthetase [Agrilactobacillus composti DSM 18527 = JCM 14202]
MGIILDALIVILVINTVTAMLTVFHRPRNITSTLAWLLALLLLPVVGFLLYAFLGRGIAQENIFDISHQEHIGLARIKHMILNDNKLESQRDNPASTTHRAKLLIHYFNRTEDSPLTKRNKVKIFTDGEAKFKALFEDIRGAKETIHVEYYSFFNDEIGNEFLRLLEQKAKEGLEVRLIYDPWGSPKANKRWFAPFVALGGEVAPFITSQNLIAKTRLNYHLHRKIVVVDGMTSWTGGFNVGDQYLGRKKKFGYWRDTHIRIVGTASSSLQERFIMDWNASVKHEDQKVSYNEKYFRTPDPLLTGTSNIQVVSDGPDSQEEILKGGTIRAILEAKKSILIQSPYLIPDEPMINALMVAARSGINIKIMIPCMPDHPFIYRATQYYANFLQRLGIEIYIYENGFLHAKTLVIDNEICSVGSMNQDFRSYALNFECNTYIYDSEVSQQLTEIFFDDMLKSTLLTDDMIEHQGRWLKFKQYFSRLLSPIL